MAVHEGKLFSGSDDKTVRVWDPASSWTCVRTLEGFPAEVRSLQVCGDKLAAGMFKFGGGIEGRIEVRSLESGEVVRTLEGHTGHTHSVISLTMLRGKLVSGSYDNTIKIWG